MSTDKNPEEILIKIEEIMKNKSEYDTIKNNFKNYKFRTLEKMQDEYCQVYQNAGNIKNERVCLTKLDDLQRKSDVYDLRVIMTYKDAELKELKKFKDNHKSLSERLKDKPKIWKTVQKLKSFLGK